MVIHKMMHIQITSVQRMWYFHGIFYGDTMTLVLKGYLMVVCFSSLLVLSYCECVCVCLFSVISKQARVAWFIFELVTLLGNPGDISLSLSPCKHVQMPFKALSRERRVCSCVCVSSLIGGYRLDTDWSKRTKEPELDLSVHDVTNKKRTDMFLNVNGLAKSDCG